MSYLLGKGQPDAEYLYKQYGYGWKEFKKAFIKKINSIDYNALARDVKPLLQNPEDQERILSFRQYIKQKL